MPSPALAYPATVAAKSRPAVTFAENTKSNLVPAVTGIFNPLVTPLLISPIEINPVNGGARLTTAPGTATKVSLGAVDWNN